MSAGDQGARGLMELQRENSNVGKACAKCVPSACRAEASSLEYADVHGGVNNSGKIGINNEVVHGNVGKVCGIRSLASTRVCAAHVEPCGAAIHGFEDVAQSVSRTGHWREGSEAGKCGIRRLAGEYGRIYSQSSDIPVR